MIKIAKIFGFTFLSIGLIIIIAILVTFLRVFYDNVIVHIKQFIIFY